MLFGHWCRFMWSVSYRFGRSLGTDTILKRLCSPGLAGLIFFWEDHYITLPLLCSYDYVGVCMFLGGLLVCSGVVWICRVLFVLTLLSSCSFQKVLPQHLVCKKQGSLTKATVIHLVPNCLGALVTQTILPASLQLTSCAGWEEDNF